MYKAFTKTPLIENLPFTIQSLLLNGNLLYIGTKDGLLLVYRIDNLAAPNPSAEFVESKKLYQGRPIDQLATIKELNTLVTLSDNIVTVHDLQTLSVQTKLPPTSGATQFAVITTKERPSSHNAQGHHSSASSASSAYEEVQGTPRNAAAAFGIHDPPPIIVARLCAAVRRKLVIFTWRDTVFESLKEINVPERIRSVAWIDSKTIAVSSDTSCSIIDLRKYQKTISRPGYSEAVRFFTSTAYKTPASRVASAAHSRQGSISSLGNLTPGDWRRTIYKSSSSLLSAASARSNPNSRTTPETGFFRWPKRTRSKRNRILRVSEADIFWVQEDVGCVLGITPRDNERNPKDEIKWSGHLLDATYFAPYAVGVIDNHYIEVRDVTGATTSTRRHSVTSTSTPVEGVPEDGVVQIIEIPQVRLVASTPTLIHSHHRHPQPEHTIAPPDEERIESSHQPATVIIVCSDNSIFRLSPSSFTDQLNLLVNAKHYEDAIGFLDAISVDDKVKEYRRIMTLRARHLFTQAKFEESLGIFQSLFTEVDYVLQLFQECEPSLDDRLATGRNGFANSHISQSPSPSNSDSGQRAATPHLVNGNATTEDQDESGDGGRSQLSIRDGDLDGLLVRFLVERRMLLAQRRQTVELKLADPQLPSPSITSLQSDLRYLYQESERVDTELLRVYLKMGPSMRKSAGALLRLHPCFVKFKESERLLMDLEYYEELMSLYAGQKLHRKALKLFAEWSAMEDHPCYGMSHMVKYLKSIREEPDDWALVKEYASYVAKQGNYEDVLSIFGGMSDPKIFEFLKTIDRDVAHTYLERQVIHFMDERPEFHDILAKTWALRIRERERLKQLALSGSNASVDDGNEPEMEIEKETSNLQERLLWLLNNSAYYSASKLLALIGQVPRDGLDIHRTVLYAHLGRHYDALTTFIEILDDEVQAEAYCHHHEQDEPSIYLLLFKIYVKNDKNPMALLEKHGNKLAGYESLELLPNDTDISDLRAFMAAVLARLRRERHASQIQKNLMKASHVQIRQRLAFHQSHRLLLDEYTICPICTKRIGTSVFAYVPTSRSIVHYGCVMGGKKAGL